MREHGSRTPKLARKWAWSSSVELAARGPGRAFARIAWVGLPRFFGEVAALFAAADTAMGPQTIEDHFGGGRGATCILAIRNAELADVLHQALNFRKLLITLVGGRQVRKLQFAAQFEPLDDGLEIDIGKVLAENAADGSADELASDGVGTLELSFVFELQFAGDGGKRGINVGDTGDDGPFAGASGTLFGAADEAFQSCDGQTLADAGAAVHTLVLAGLEGDFFHNLAEIVRHIDLLAGIAAHPGFLRRDGHAFLDACGIVGANLCADAVFERSDDLAARGVILGIGGENEEHVERETEWVALNLNVTFLHDVEEADLNFSGEVGKFVDGEDAAISAREKAVVDGELVGEIAAAAGGADGIDIADNVGHGHVGSGKFFDEAIVAGHPGDGSVVAVGGDFFAAGAADGLEWIVVDFAAGDDGHFRIEQVDEAAENAALGLAAEAEKNEIVAREQSIDDLRDDGVFVTMHAGKEGLASFDGTQEIAAQLILDGAGNATRIEIGNELEFPECARFRVSRRLHGLACRHYDPIPRPDRTETHQTSSSRVRCRRRAGAWPLPSVDAEPTREGKLPDAPGGPLPTEARGFAASTIGPSAASRQRDKRVPEARRLGDSSGSPRR